MRGAHKELQNLEPKLQSLEPKLSVSSSFTWGVLPVHSSRGRAWKGGEIVHIVAA